jgi:hypothetical protein
MFTILCQFRDFWLISDFWVRRTLRSLKERDDDAIFILLLRCCLLLFIADCSFTATAATPYLDYLLPVTPSEVMKLLKSTKPKSSQLDFIPTSLIKSCSDTFSDIICHLANLSFTEGKFPSSVKTAIVSPLIKRPDLDPSLPANYRPISNLNNISKLVEKLFLARLLPHVTSSANFNPLQSAYRPLHSTVKLAEYKCCNK